LKDELGLVYFDGKSEAYEKKITSSMCIQKSMWPVISATRNIRFGNTARYVTSKRKVTLTFESETYNTDI